MMGFVSPDNRVLEVYKVYADGYEELMHGEELSSMTVAAFKAFWRQAINELFIAPLFSLGSLRS